MSDEMWLAEQFEANRQHLRTVAYRMLGSQHEADDAVQEAWIRLSRTDTSDVGNLAGWLTTVVSRVCLDTLRSRRVRREQSLETRPIDLEAAVPGPEQDAVLADSVGLALLVVLDTLTPAERVVFVLHDMFAVRFDEIASIVGRSSAAARQLASRARARVQGSDPDPAADVAGRRAVIDAFLAAARGGDLDALLELLDPDVVVRADGAAVRFGAVAEVSGAAGVVRTFAGRALAARPALVEGDPGLVWTQRGVPQAAFEFAIVDGRIVEISVVAEPEHLERLRLEVG